MAMSQSVYRVHRAKSANRATRLQSYLTEHVWDPSTRRLWADFKCEFKEDCAESACRYEFYEAQGHAVGSCYDLSTEDGVDYRVLVVPIDVGGSGDYAGVEKRTDDIRESGRLPVKKRFRGDDKRNAHMQGVTLALRLAFGLPYEKSPREPFNDPSEEQVTFTDGTHAYLFECFAMANMTLCSAVTEEGSMKSCQSQIMRDNCAKHLVETIGILQPTLVISQGSKIAPTLRRNLGVKHQIDLNLDHGDLYDCELNGDRFVWVALYHPTRKWSSINHRYFKRTVVKAIPKARARALKLG